MTKKNNRKRGRRKRKQRAQFAVSIGFLRGLSPMELSGTVLRQVTNSSFSRRIGCGGECSDAVVRRGGVVRVSVRARMMGSSSGFCDEGHLQYYSRCGGKDKGGAVLTTKKKLKLLNGFTKSLSLFPELDDLQGNLTSDAAEVLLKQLEQQRAEEKEMKRKRKQEKKAKLNASKMKTVPDCESSSSSSSESSDSECGKVVDMNSLRGRAGVAPSTVDELQPPALQAMLSPLALLPQTITVEKPREDHARELCSSNDTCVSSISATTGFKNETSAPQKRIEVCMGNKCKRSGAAALLQEFERVVGVEAAAAAVVGCKCMGKCKSAPNVRIQNSLDDSLAKGLNDSVQIPANPLCIGVGLEDVDTIVARFFGENQEDTGVAAAAT